MNKAILIVAFVYSCLTLYYFRKLNTVLSFREGALTVLILNFVFSLLISAFCALLLTVDQDFFTNSIDKAIQSLEESKEVYLLNSTLEKFETGVNGIKDSTPFSIATDFFFKFSLVGIVYSLVIAIIFKRNET